MMNRKPHRNLFALPVLMGALALASSGSLAWASDHQESMLKSGEKNGIRYVHGGVGKEAMKKIEGMDEDYDLQAIFTNAKGAYLAQVEVMLKRKDGDHELTLTTQGPVLLADLPAGEYRLTANVPGRSKAQHSFTSRGDDHTELRLQLED